MAYCDKQTFATDDALRCGRLHTFLPAWKPSMRSFMESGGYRVRERVKDLQPRTLVVWCGASVWARRERLWLIA